MTEVLSYCCNCNPSAAFATGTFPYVCERCQADPYRINLLAAIENLLALSSIRDLSDNTFRVVLEYLTEAKSKCDTNPSPVIIGLIFTELYPDGGKILMVQRAIPPEVGGWALVSGFIIDQLSWQENLRKEAVEEASVTLDTTHMEPFSFDNNTPRKNLMLNFAVVKPSGVVRINDFAPDHETLDRMEFRFSKEVRPPFCFPIHQQMLDAWCAQYFQW